MVLYPNKLPESERVCSGICIREKKAQDSLFYQEMFHSEKLRIRKDDVEKTRQYLKEREH